MQSNHAWWIRTLRARIKAQRESREKRARLWERFWLAAEALAFVTLGMVIQWARTAI